ncbi:MAG: lamin tail domain-containing protein [Cyclobacteriaceae bacterium]
MRVFISTSFALIMCINLSYGQIRNIVINEFMFDPVPSYGLPEIEYVEILNISDEPFYISGWGLNGHIIPEFMIMPGQFLVLCKSSEIHLIHPGIEALGLERWDVLNNTGQTISLTDNNLNTIDSVTYDGTWIPDKEKSPGGWALELINPYHPCSGKNNWAVSENLNGGTPGFNNSVFNITPDNTPPEIINSATLDDGILQIRFSELVDFNDTDHLTAFEFPDENIEPELAISGYTDVQHLILPEPLQPGKTYQLMVKDLADCWGNSIRDTTLHFGIGIEPEFNDVLITEILADEIPSVGLPESEYLEILNDTDQLLSIGNSFIFTRSELYPLPEHDLFPGDYYLLIPKSKEKLFENYSNTILMERFPILNNDGKDLAIYNRKNGTIFSISYDKSWYKYIDKSNGGYSIEMIDIRNPCGDLKNWTASVSAYGGTPGYLNSVNNDNPDLTRPGILSAQALEEELIVVRFDEKLHADCFQDLDVFVNDHIMTGLWIYDTIDFNSLEISVKDNPAINLSYELSLNGIRDCAGNFMNEGNSRIQVTVPGKPSIGDIIINEILFNPNPGGVDWIELYNRTEKYLDMKDWYLAGEEFPSGEQKHFISEDHFLMEPYSFLVLTEDTDILIRDYPDTDRKYCLEITDLPALPDKGGYIALWTSDSIKLEELYFSEDQHNLLLKETEGISLERVSPDFPSDAPENWHSASSNSGYGTPTQINSQFRNAAVNTYRIGLYPKVISPDQDGLDDILHIFIDLQKTGYLANIYIFNLSGALLKKLARGKLLGAKEDITWDGNTDKGYTAGPGHYILLMELFHPDGDMIKEKKNFVVARKF